MTREDHLSLEHDHANRSTLTPGIDQRTAQAHVADQQQNDQRRRQSYSEHPVLDLKAFVGKLGDQDARIANLLFALVREDYERSGYHIKELAKLFAPLRERYDREWTIVEQRGFVFTKAMSEVLEYEALAGDLHDAKA